MPISSRRGLLVAAGATGLLAATRARAEVSDVGPRNAEITAQNPSMFTPPPTDHGNLGALSYSFSAAHNKRTAAGWAREVTVRQFPISKEVAGVNMRLAKGGVRELHWHKAAEWAYMLYGSARITAVDQNARHFVADVREGDLWFFPGGIPHSIQGLEPDGCEFLLAFNDGDFSEDNTFQITEWMARTPREVLAKNLAMDPALFDKVPSKELYIFAAPLPGTLAADLAQSQQPEVPDSYAFRLLEQTPIRTRSGTVRIADRNNFTASQTMSAALVEVAPGGLRELHWHPLASEWQYYIAGEARMTVFAHEAANTVDFRPGDVGYVPKAMGHYIENTGKDTLRFLEIFANGQYADVSLSSWMANTPRELVAAHLGIDEAVLARIPQTKTPVVPA
jgi:oxalate decarboxylase